MARKYTVRTGDNWFSVAKRLGLSPNTLAAANNNVSTFRPGVVLNVPTPNILSTNATGPLTTGAAPPVTTGTVPPPNTPPPANPPGGGNNLFLPVFGGTRTTQQYTSPVDLRPLANSVNNRGPAVSYLFGGPNQAGATGQTRPPEPFTPNKNIVNPVTTMVMTELNAGRLPPLIPHAGLAGTSIRPDQLAAAGTS